MRHHLAAASRRAAVVALLASIAVVAGWVVGPSPAAACSCVEAPPPETALREADAVFTGEVTDLTEQDAGSLGRVRVAHLAVTEVFRGDVHEEAEVATPLDPAACGHPFELGREELVYAVLDDEGRLLTNLCDRTAPVAEATGDLDAFADGVEPAPSADDGVRSPPSWLLPAALMVVLAAALVLLLRRRGARPRP